MNNLPMMAVSRDWPSKRYSVSPLAFSFLEWLLGRFMQGGDNSRWSRGLQWPCGTHTFPIQHNHGNNYKLSGSALDARLRCHSKVRSSPKQRIHTGMHTNSHGCAQRWLSVLRTHCLIYTEGSRRGTVRNGLLFSELVWNHQRYILTSKWLSFNSRICPNW